MIWWTGLEKRLFGLCSCCGKMVDGEVGVMREIEFRDGNGVGRDPSD